MGKIQAVPFDAKRCGACLYWQGDRTICQCDVQYDDGAVGKCSNPDSPAFGRGVPVIFTCFSKKDIR